MVDSVAAKVMLQKALFEKLDKRIQGVILSPEQFPLSSAVVPTGIAYRSAIALKLAAQTSLFADIVAHDLSQCFIERPFLENRRSQVIWANWSIQIEASGWISFTFSDDGIAQWLQHLCSVFAKHPPESWAIDSSSVTPVLPNQELCHQLRLSLPMFFQWSYVQCCRWLQHIEACQREAEVTLQLTAHAPKSQWEWTAASPLPCHQLLQTLCAAVDRIATASTHARILLTQGYTVAAAFYQFQSVLPRETVHSLSPAVQTSLWSLHQAIRHVLAQVITRFYQQQPAQSF
ncbi:MAG: hypothetical protein AAGH78_16920 [Cyanobacteria bacterium P01_H01_bin.58]